MNVKFAVRNSAKPVAVNITGDERKALESLAGVDKFGMPPHKPSAEQVVKELLNRSQELNYVDAEVSVETDFSMRWDVDNLLSSWFETFTAIFTVLIDGRNYVVECTQFGRATPLSVVDGHSLRRLACLIDSFDWFKAHAHELMYEELTKAIADRKAERKTMFHF